MQVPEFLHVCTHFRQNAEKHFHQYPRTHIRPMHIHTEVSKSHTWKLVVHYTGGYWVFFFFKFSLSRINQDVCWECHMFFRDKTTARVIMTQCWPGGEFQWVTDDVDFPPLCPPPFFSSRPSETRHVQLSPGCSTSRAFQPRLRCCFCGVFFFF